MGVHGLWRLIDPSGKPVALETLENKVLAVDVSIWLHQAVKGFQDSKGAPVPNAHLLGIYHRVCKLLYFKIKPVFIFDGGVPVLKKQTIAKRNQQKSRTASEAEKLQRQLLSTLLKHSAISKVLSEKTKASLALPQKKASKHENMYALPSSELDSTVSSSEEEEDIENITDVTDDNSNPSKHWDLHTIDMSSTHFKSLPVDVRHEILTELKETRKQNSWGRLHELPKQSGDFSFYQVNRLLKRQAVQSALEDAEKEMGGHSLSLAELESILKDHGVVTTNDIGKRIASDENTRYLYIKDVKQALEKAKSDKEKLEAIQEGNEDCTKLETENKNKADLEFEEDLEKAIALSLQEEPSTSKSEISSSNDSKNRPKFSFLDNFNDGDFESEDDEVEEVPAKTKFASAQNYMTEYSGLTPNEINKILNDKKGLLIESIKKQMVEKKITTNKMEIKPYRDDVNHDNKNDNTTDLNKNSSRHNMFKKSDGKFEVMESVNGNNASIKEIVSDHDKTNTTIVLLPDHTNDVVTATGSTKTGKVDTLSDSDASSYEDFEEVSEETISKDKDSIEIVIDPSQTLEDDLFGDVFNKHDEQKKTDASEILVQSQSKLNTDSLNDTLDREKNKHDEKHTAPIVERSPTHGDENDLSSKGFNKSTDSNQDVQRKAPEPNEGANIKENRKDAPEETVTLENSKVKVQNLNIEQMTRLKSDLQRKKIDILVEKSTKERMASNITDQMYQEAQDLLELFGVPYIIAPMEAEAQCAFLDAIELTDGTITDDSDIWLFGGRTVYKNFFNQSKYVMEFKVEDITHHFKLTREQMILLALLVGSDYTIGLQGVGPVTALEILAAFQPLESKEFSLSHTELLSGLKEFRSWFNKGKSGGPGRSTLKNKLKNIAFTDNFPSLQVVQAYLEPTVETSKEQFSWSKPDFVGLTDLAKEKFGWSSKKTEEILKPVIKKVEEHQTQKSIKDYFKTVSKANLTDAKNQMSKRVKSAIDRIGKTPQELIVEEMEALSAEKQKRTRRQKNSDSCTSKTKTKRKNEETSGSKTKQKKEETQSKPKRMKKNNSEDPCGTSSKPMLKDVKDVKESRTKTEDSKSKKSNTRKKVSKNESTEQTKTVDDNSEDIKKYEDIAMELKKRRQRRNELPKKDETISKKKKPLPNKTVCAEIIPPDLKGDEEIEILRTTASVSSKKVEEIERDIKNSLEQDVKKPCLPDFHKREVIHQKLRDKSDVLRNKLKAIEVFRKSKKGPGYIPKRGKKKVLLKEDAELSENSSDD